MRCMPVRSRLTLAREWRQQECCRCNGCVTVLDNDGRSHVAPDTRQIENLDPKTSALNAQVNPASAQQVEGSQLWALSTGNEGGPALQGGGGGGDAADGSGSGQV